MNPLDNFLDKDSTLSSLTCVVRAQVNISL